MLLIECLKSFTAKTSPDRKLVEEDSKSRKPKTTNRWTGSRFAAAFGRCRRNSLRKFALRVLQTGWIQRLLRLDLEGAIRMVFLRTWPITAIRSYRLEAKGIRDATRLGFCRHVKIDWLVPVETRSVRSASQRHRCPHDSEHYANGP